MAELVGILVQNQEDRHLLDFMGGGWKIPRTGSKSEIRKVRFVESDILTEV